MKTIGHPIILGLPDLCADIFTFCLQLQRTKDPGDAEALRLKIDELFRSLETRAKESEVPEPHLADVKYAICAYIDEMVLNSDWKLKESWSGNPLQMHYFNSFAAGEEFFTKLETYRHMEDKRKIDVLEIYYTCMTLGFRGMHADLQGLEKLKLMIDSIGKEIRKVRGGTDSTQLSSGKIESDSTVQQLKNFPAWLVPIICGAILLLLFIILTLVIGGSVSDVESTLTTSS